MRFEDVVSVLAREMSAKRILAVSSSVFDGGLADDADVLESEDVIRRTPDGKVAFFHETFFDYAFARAWVGDQQDLVGFLTEGKQELFRRAQVRQILLHLHEANPDRFAWELERLLSSDHVRFHLKHVGISVVGALPRPSSRAWGAVANVLKRAPQPIARRLRAALRTAGWFERLKAEGVLAQWLADRALRDHAVGIMAAAAKESPDRIAAVLQHHAGDGRFDPWIRVAARYADLTLSRTLFDVVLAGIRRGVWNEHDHSLWIDAAALKEKPDWAVELLAAYLVERPGALDLKNGKVAAISRREDQARELITAAAAGAPLQFWQHLGPWLLDVMALTASPCDDDGRPVPHVQFDHRSWPLRGNEIEDALLAAAATALRALAASDQAITTDQLRTLLQPVVDDPHDAAQWLLYRALEAAGSKLADFAADIVLQAPWRMRSGYLTNPYWTTRDLLAAITPHVSDERYAALESAVLAHRAPHEAPGEHYSQHTLIDGLAVDRMSDRTRRRRGELDRLYGPLASPRPPFLTGTVPSPVPGSAIPHMTDDDWSRALLKYAGRDRFAPGGGGAEQLAAQLRQATIEDPDRFVALGMTPEVASDPNYVRAILGGLRETNRSNVSEDAVGRAAWV